MINSFSRLLMRWYRLSRSHIQASLSAAKAECNCAIAFDCLCTMACKSGLLPPYMEPLGDMTRLEAEVNGSMFW